MKCRHAQPKKRCFIAEPYGYAIHACKINEAVAYGRRYLEYDIEITEGAVAQCNFIESQRAILISLPNSRKIACVAHECLHALHHIYKDTGIIYDIVNDEPACYMLDYIVSNVLEMMYG